VGGNEGPNHVGCAVLAARDGAPVDSSPWLTLSIAIDDRRLAYGQGTAYVLSLFGDSAGQHHQPAYFPLIRFVASTGTGAHITSFAEPQPDLTAGTFVADNGDGEYLIGQVDTARSAPASPSARHPTRTQGRARGRIRCPGRRRDRRPARRRARRAAPAPRAGRPDDDHPGRERLQGIGPDPVVRPRGQGRPGEPRPRR
jgi:hypothetical protein